MPRLALLAVAILGIVLAACGAGDGAVRTTQVRMFDAMRYDPASFEFSAGDTVQFEVTNEGEVTHEFFVGDTQAHEEHAAEMREGGHSDEAHDNQSAVEVQPGESATLTYTFEEAGELLAACHEPGHYEAGMVAPITVHP